MNKKIRILHLLCSDRFSGAENVVCQIVKMFDNIKEFEMIYASPDGQIRKALKERGVSFFAIKSVTPSEFKRVIFEIKPDIIHAHDMKASFLVAMTCGKIPLVSHIHNNNFDARKLTIKAVLYKFAARKAKHIFWVSQSSFEGYCFHKDFVGKSTILYNVIDRAQLLKKAQNAECADSYDIVYLGRLTEQKNPQRLVSILERITSVKSDLQVAIIGSGELENIVRDLIEEKKLKKNLHMLGFMSNPYGILQNANLMIMTSRWEGTPMCALEAMALGVPIVSTPTDGLKELVVQGETGYLVESDEVFAEMCCKILMNQENQKYLSKRAIERSIELMDLVKYKNELLYVYKKCVGEGGE